MLPAVSEFRLLRTVSARGHQPNVLIVCEDRLVDSVVARVTRWSAQPLHSCAPGEWHLPRHAGGALVVNDLGSLTSDQQTALFEWMNTDGQGTQVVSVARPGLQTRLRDGAFSEALFFRLNILQIEVSCRQTDSTLGLAMVG